MTTTRVRNKSTQHIGCLRRRVIRSRDRPLREMEYHDSDSTLRSPSTVQLRARPENCTCGRPLETIALPIASCRQYIALSLRLVAIRRTNHATDYARHSIVMPVA